MITSVVALTFTLKSFILQPQPVMKYKQLVVPNKIERIVPKPIKRQRNIIRTFQNSA